MEKEGEGGEKSEVRGNMKKGKEEMKERRKKKKKASKKYLIAS